ncbi:MAG: transcriptional regulator [Eggerthellaceae bacterium]|nr:transcriptional regulator [Eggerthellaceae bacterium]
MNDSAKTLAKMKKAGKLVRLSQRKNGPKSYKRGQGALLRVLLENDGATQRELVSKLGMNRAALKDIVRKANRNGYVTIEKAGEKKLYAVKLTDDGRKLAKKHEEAQDKAAEEILSALSADERAQLDAINEKLIVSLKEAGIDGKKKGRKHHRKGHKHSRRLH